MSILDVAPPRSLPRGTADEVDRRLFPDEVQHGDDPVGWIGARLKEMLWEKQRQIARALVEHGHVAVPSCHSSGKSFLASRLACWWLDVHPIGSARVITTAPSQHQVKTVLWGEIGAAKQRGGLDGHITRGQVPEWTVGGRVVAFGRKPQDLGTPEQAMQAFQGIHAEYVLVILDEAGGIPQWLFDAAETLATGEHDRILAIGNPDDPASYFEEICRPGSGWQVIPISAFDTPRFTGEAIDDRIPLISKKWVEERGKRWGDDSPIYQSKVLGRFPDISDDTLFPPRLISAAHRSELDGMERGGYGGDVARYGEDETVVYRNRGGVIRLTEAARKQDTVETTGMFARILRQHGAANVAMYVDGDGLGAGVYDALHHQGLAALEWRGGFPAHDDERFVNRRAEMFWQLREAMEAGQIDLDPNDDDLAAQLGKLKWKTDGRGRIQVESKEDMRKRGVRSPDRADAAAMAFAAPVTPLEVQDRPAAAEALTDDLFDREL